MRPLPAIALVALFLLPAAPVGADQPPEPMPWCDLPVAGQDPVTQLVVHTVEEAGDEACHAQNCIAYSHLKLVLIRQCLGV